MTSNIGFSKINDRLSASRTLSLKLKKDDTIMVKQEEEDHKVPDVEISFCVALIHLNKVGVRAQTQTSLLCMYTMYTTYI